MSPRSGSARLAERHSKGAFRLAYFLSTTCSVSMPHARTALKIVTKRFCRGCSLTIHTCGVERPSPATFSFDRLDVRVRSKPLLLQCKSRVSFRELNVLDRFDDPIEFADANRLLLDSNVSPSERLCTMCADQDTDDVLVRKCRMLLDPLIEICATEELALEMWRRIIGLHFDGRNPPALRDEHIPILLAWLVGATKAVTELTNSGFFDEKA